MLPTYEGVCRSELYQLLKQLLPSQAEFPHTFTLAQLLLRAPCSPLLLAVRFGRQAAARALVAATLQSCGGGSRSKDGSSCAPAVAAEHLGAALAHWPLAPEPQAGLLARLLAAGACPLHRLLPNVLRRYRSFSPTSATAGRLRLGLRAVLEHVLGDLPSSNSNTADEASSSDNGDASPSSSGSSSSSSITSTSSTSSTSSRSHGGGPAFAARPRQSPSDPKHLRQLLAAAVACRDGPRCQQVLAALGAGSPAASAPWSDFTANCEMLVAAAEHDMSAVVAQLLALPPPGPPPGLGPPPFSPNMWGPAGTTALMVAAHRGSLAALEVLLAHGATVNLGERTVLVVVVAVV